jgi:alpha-tubulin suppressor-like RCC1 family protein
VKGLNTRVSRIAAGDKHSLAVTYDGILHATGSNEHSELGMSDTKEVARFTPVTDLEHIRIKQIAAGSH